MKKQNNKESSAKKTFLILAIVFFVLTVVGFVEVSAESGLCCLLCGIVCIAIYFIKKKKSKQNSAEVTEVATANDSPVKQFNNNAQPTVEIVFSDGHSEMRSILETINLDEGCLITDGGRTYHNKVSCFRRWSEEYRETFTKWRLISLEDAEKMGLRRCNFCYGYEIAKEKPDAVVLSISCAAQKYQDSLILCNVGERCEIDYDVECDKYIVSCGDEIGYLTEKQIESHDIDISFTRVFIDEIIEQENGKYKVKILIS